MISAINNTHKIASPNTTTNTAPPNPTVNSSIIAAIINVINNVVNNTMSIPPFHNIACKICVKNKSLSFLKLRLTQLFFIVKI